MKPILKQVLFVILITIVSLQGMEKTSECVKGTYKSIPLNASNLMSFAQPISDEANTIIMSWIETHDDLLTKLLTRALPLAEFKKEQEEKVELVSNAHLENHSKHNYVFSIAKDGVNQYFVKISGVKNRLNNLLIYNGKNGIWSEEDYQKYNEAELNGLATLPTYQTVSRFAHYLRISEAISTMNLTRIKVPKTYVISRSENLVDDEHAIIVEEAIVGAVKLEAADRSLTDQEINELVQLTKYAGLWCFRDNILITDTTLYLIDLEQPDNSNPTAFFHKDQKKYEWNVWVGLKKISLLFEKESAQQEVLRNIIKNDEELAQSSVYVSHIKRFFKI